MMRMTTRVAYDNMKYNKSRNMLVGIAIVLTILLLFVVPTVGKGMLDVQYEAVNELYPSWHALYRNIDEKTARQLAAHHDISCYGLRGDAGIIGLEDAAASMLYMDETGLELYKVELEEGRLPQQEDEIVVSEGLLEALGKKGGIGDRIVVPYQIYRDGELDFTQQGEFQICGLLREEAASRQQKAYVALISEAFLKRELPADQIVYRFLFQIDDAGNPNTDEIEETIRRIAAQFEIAENETNINEEYLGANYVDPVTIPVIVGIMVIIMLAGVITIYSIYYVSMNQRIREFGRLKAIGATKRQIRQIVLREGLCVAAAAIPIGLLLGTLASGMVLPAAVDAFGGDSQYMEVVRAIIHNNKVNIYHWWIYLLAAAVTLCTVYASLVRPMHIAAGISEVEAMRAQGTNGKSDKRRKGYAYLTIGRLTCRNFTENKKKSIVTILAMSVTGMFLMVVATVLSCANPTESANNTIAGQYELSPVVEEHNKEHPELKWAEVQKNNPLTEELRQQIEALAGVERVDAFTTVRVTGGPMEEDDHNEINGVPEQYAVELEKGIVEGKVTYEELKSGDKVIVDRKLLRWYPDIRVGDRICLTIHDGDRTYDKEFVVAAFGDYRSGILNYAYFIMAKDAADALCENNSTGYFHVMADKEYDKGLEEALNEIVDASGKLEMRTWKKEYENWKSAIGMTSTACYAFLGILSVISVMNLINTMLNSVHVRKRELGMMQAIGMSDRQLMKMLQLEGIIYTLCTLLMSVGVGSLAGYPVFLYAKKDGLFAIETYRYPAKAAIIVSVVLLLIQILLAAGISKSVRKDSLIERVRFSE